MKLLLTCVLLSDAAFSQYMDSHYCPIPVIIPSLSHSHAEKGTSILACVLTSGIQEKLFAALIVILYDGRSSGGSSIFIAFLDGVKRSLHLKR